MNLMNLAANDRDNAYVSANYNGPIISSQPAAAPQPDPGEAAG